jgi:hypothetical protein
VIAPSIRQADHELRPDERGAPITPSTLLDEVIARAPAHLHLERLDDRTGLLLVELRDGGTLRVRVYAGRRGLRVTAEVDGGGR